MKKTISSLMLVLILAGCSFNLSQAPTPAPGQDNISKAVAMTLTARPSPTQGATKAPALQDTPTTLGTAGPTGEPTERPTRTLVFTPTINIRTPSTPTEAPSNTPAATPGAGSLLPGVPIEGSACIPTTTTQELGVVLKVISGDTLLVLINGANKTVRYIGIQTPLLGSGGKPPAHLAPEALQMNKNLAEGKVIVMIRDTTDADKSDVLLRYVVAGNLFANYELVRQGMALSINTPPDQACRATFDGAQALASQAQIGLWLPTPTPLPGVTSTARPSDH